MTVAGRTLRYVGFAPEVTFGVPRASVWHVDIVGASLDVPVDSERVFTGILDQSPTVKRPGFYAPSGDVRLPVDIRTIGWLLRWALGGYRFTGGVLNRHEVWAAQRAILPPFTTRLGRDVFEHVFSGCVINRLSLNVADAFVDCTVGIIAQRDSGASLSEIDSLLLLSEYPLTFHEVTVKLARRGEAIGGSTISHLVKSFSLTLENGVSVEAGQGLGQRFPYRLVAQMFTMSVAMDLVLEGASWMLPSGLYSLYNVRWSHGGLLVRAQASIPQLERFWGTSSGPSTVPAGSTELHAEVTISSGEFGSLVLYFPRVFVTQISQQSSGKGELVQSIVLSPLLSRTRLADTSEVRTTVLATLLNGQGNMA